MIDCQECDNLGIFHACRKEHDIYYKDGCKQCGRPYPASKEFLKFYIEATKCKDFKQRYFESRG